MLSSGREADYYVDLRRVTLDAEAAPLVGEVMLDATVDLDYDAVGGLTLGADPVATAMLHAAAARGRRLDAFVVRKEGNKIRRYIHLSTGNYNAATTRLYTDLALFTSAPRLSATRWSISFSCFCPRTRRSSTTTTRAMPS